MPRLEAQRQILRRRLLSEKVRSLSDRMTFHGRFYLLDPFNTLSSSDPSTQDLGPSTQDLAPRTQHPGPTTLLDQLVLAQSEGELSSRVGVVLAFDEFDLLVREGLVELGHQDLRREGRWVQAYVVAGP